MTFGDFYFILFYLGGGGLALRRYGAHDRAFMGRGFWGFQVWYPVGAIESSRYTHAAVPAVPSDWDPDVFTSVTTSSENLNSVWELCRYTLRVAMLDVNTDSNTRQRDPCNWDSHLQALGQAAIAPAGSIPYRKRSVTFLFEPDAHVMVWSEFFLFTL